MYHIENNAGEIDQHFPSQFWDICSVALHMKVQMLNILVKWLKKLTNALMLQLYLLFNFLHARLVPNDSKTHWCLVQMTIIQEEARAMKVQVYSDGKYHIWAQYLFSMSFHSHLPAGAIRKQSGGKSQNDFLLLKLKAQMPMIMFHLLAAKIS